MKKLLLIINPSAGKSAMSHSLYEVSEVFVKGGYDLTVYISKSGEDMRHTVRDRAMEFDVVVCCGGDGTINIATKGMYEANIKKPLGYIPCGTTNDFALSRKISSVPAEAASQIVEGVKNAIDVGFFNSKIFVYVAAFGVFSEVSYQTPAQMKKNIGHAAYVFEGIKSLMKIKPYSMNIEYDGGMLEGDFIYGMITNTRRVGGFSIPMIADVCFDDGLMEVTLVRHPKTTTDSQRLLNSLITQVPDSSLVYHFQTSSLKYTSEEKIQWTLDGEYGGNTAHANIHVEQSTLELMY